MRKEHHDQRCHQRCLDGGADFCALVLRRCDRQKKGGGADRVDDDKLDNEGGQEILDHGVCPAWG